MSNPMMGQFCWNELATKDVQKAKDFYGNVFGWKFKEIKTDEMNYTLISAHDKDFAGIWQIPKEKEQQIPSHWMSYILVDSLSKALEKAKKHGAKVKVDITKAGDMGQFAIIIDPTNAHIALW